MKVLRKILAQATGEHIVFDHAALVLSEGE